MKKASKIFTSKKVSPNTMKASNITVFNLINRLHDLHYYLSTKDTPKHQKAYDRLTSIIDKHYSLLRG